MASDTPPFWWTKPDWRAAALTPFAALYGYVAARRLRNARRQRVGPPVLCVGNFTVGGSGKTPVAISFAETAKRMHLAPGILSRGHGGSFSAPHVVDPRRDSAAHVGDAKGDKRDPLAGQGHGTSCPSAWHAALALPSQDIARRRALDPRSIDRV